MSTKPVQVVPSGITVDKNGSISFSGSDAIFITDPNYTNTLTTTLTAKDATFYYDASLLPTGITISGEGTGSVTVNLLAGTPQANLDAALALLVLKQNFDFVGTYNVAVTTKDAAGISSGTAYIPINVAADTPTETLPTVPLSVAENGTLALNHNNAITVQDADQSGNMIVTLKVTEGTLNVSSLLSDVTVTGRGTNTLTLKETNGPQSDLNAELSNVVYKAPTGVINTATLTVTTTVNGNSSGPASVTLDIGTPLKLTLPASQLDPENSNLVFSTANNNAISVSDPNVTNTSDQLTITVVGGGAIELPGGNAATTLTVNGSPGSINTAINGLTYIPANNTTGSVTLDLTFKDVNGHATTTGTETFTITPPPAPWIGSTPTINLNSLNGNNGFSIIDSAQPNDSAISELGLAVNPLANFNGHGNALILGAPGNDTAAVVYADYLANNKGAADGLVNGSFQLTNTSGTSNLDGNNGFTITGFNPNEFLGASLSGTGSVTGHGNNDYAIGAPYGGASGNGTVYVLLNGTDNGTGNVNLAASNVVALNDSQSNAMLGTSLALTEINGDGYSDVIAGAPGTNNYAGAINVYLGSANFSSATTPTVINGASAGDYAGLSLASVNEGTSANSYLLIGAPQAGNYNEPGLAYLLPNSSIAAAASASTSINLANITSNSASTSGYQFIDSAAPGGALLGYSVADIGNINGGGVDDYAITAPGENEVFVVFGGQATLNNLVALTKAEGITTPNTIDLNLLNNDQGKDGFVVTDSNTSYAASFLGLSVSAAGDFNGNGYGSFVVSDSNQAYVIFGGPSFNEKLDLATPLNGNNGITLTAPDSAPYNYNYFTVGYAGNTNGLGDVILSNSFTGQSYVVDGFNPLATPSGFSTPILIGGNSSSASLNIDATLQTNDGSETLSTVSLTIPQAEVGEVSLSNNGVTLTPVINSDGSETYSVTATQLSGLTLNAAANIGANFAITVSASATENSTHAVATTTTSLPVEIDTSLAVTAPALTTVHATPFSGGTQPEVASIVLQGTDSANPITDFVINQLGTFGSFTGELYSVNPLTNPNAQPLAANATVAATLSMGDTYTATVYYEPSTSAAQTQFTFAAQDSLGLNSNQATAAINVAPALRAPTVNYSVANQLINNIVTNPAVEDQNYSYQLPTNLFSDPNAGGAITSLQLVASSPSTQVPDWLTLQQVNGVWTLESTLPTGPTAGDVNNLNAEYFSVVATDNFGLSSQVVNLSIPVVPQSPTNDTPLVTVPAAPLTVTAGTAVTLPITVSLAETPQPYTVTIDGVPGNLTYGIANTIITPTSTEANGTNDYTFTSAQFATYNNNLHLVAGANFNDGLPAFSYPQISVEATNTEYWNGGNTVQTFHGGQTFSVTVQAPIDVNNLTPQTGYILQGNTSNLPTDTVGGALTTFTDPNGYSDIAIGSSLHDPNVYVVFGGAHLNNLAGAGDTINLPNLANGTGADGYVITDSNANAQNAFGSVLATGNFMSATPDLFISNPGYGVFVVNTTAITGSTFDVNTQLNGSNGMEIIGQSIGYGIGNSLAAGNYSADGFTDIAIGAPYASNPLGSGNAGAVYIVDGGQNLGTTFNVANLNGSNGYTIYDSNSADSSIGWNVANVGNVVGDGHDALLISGGEPNSGINSGETTVNNYLLFGGSLGNMATPTGTIDLAQLLQPNNGGATDGYVIQTPAAATVNAIGDINGSGYADLFFGMPAGTTTMINGVATPLDGFVVYGGNALSDLAANGTNGVINLATELAPGSPEAGKDGFAVTGVAFTGNDSVTASSAGNFHGTSLDDLLINIPDQNLPYNNTGSGASYLIFGSNNIGSNVNLTSLNNATGLEIPGGQVSVGSYGNVGGGSFGFASAMGDFNHAGHSDLLIGAPHLASTYLLF